MKIRGKWARRSLKHSLKKNIKGDWLGPNWWNNFFTNNTEWVQLSVIPFMKTKWYLCNSTFLFNSFDTLDLFWTLIAHEAINNDQLKNRKKFWPVQNLFFVSVPITAELWALLGLHVRLSCRQRPCDFSGHLMEESYCPGRWETVVRSVQNRSGVNSSIITTKQNVWVCFYYQVGYF